MRRASMLIAGFALLMIVGMPTAPHARADSADPLVLVLDASSSMAATTPDGQPRIAVARASLSTMIDDLPQQAPVGVRFYGAEEEDRDEPDGCTDSELMVDIETGNRDDLRDALDDYEPAGQSPIAHALTESATDLGQSGPARMILLASGPESCSPDPCALAAEVIDSASDLRIDVIGLDADDQTRDQLSCIAEVGNGTYYDARDSTDLSAALAAGVNGQDAEAPTSAPSTSDPATDPPSPAQPSSDETSTSTWTADAGTTVAQPPPRRPQPNPWLVASAIGAVVLFGGIGLGAWWLLRRW